MRRAVLIAIATVVAAAGLYVVRERRQQEDRITALAKHVTELERQQPSCKNKQSSRSSAHSSPEGRASIAAEPAAPEGVAAIPDSQGDPETNRKSRSTRTITEQDLRDHFQAIFVADNADPNRTRAFRQDLEERLKKNPATNSKIRRIECRAALCQVETEHANRAEFRRFFDEQVVGTPTPLWDDASFNSIIEENAKATVSISYIARDGSALPALN